MLREYVSHLISWGTNLHMEHGVSGSGHCEHRQGQYGSQQGGTRPHEMGNQTNPDLLVLTRPQPVKPIHWKGLGFQTAKTAGSCTGKTAEEINQV